MATSPSIEQPVEVRLALEEGRPAVPASVQARLLSSRERSMRVVGSWAVLWAIAAACIPIPILHFILVPSFFLAGPIVAWRKGKATAVIQSGTLPCARCAQTVTIDEPAFGWPAEVFCKACGVSLSVTPAALPAASSAPPSPD